MKYQSRIKFNPNIGKYGVYTAEVRSKTNILDIFWGEWHFLTRDTEIYPISSITSFDEAVINFYPIFFYSREEAEKVLKKFFEKIELEKKQSKSSSSWKTINEDEYEV